MLNRSILQSNRAVLSMEIRYDIQNKRTLVQRFETLLGPDFLADFAAFVSDHEIPMGNELAIEWHEAKATAVMFDSDNLLLLRIRQRKSDTPCSAIAVGEVNFYPTKKIKPIPLKRK